MRICLTNLQKEFTSARNKQFHPHPLSLLSRRFVISFDVDLRTVCESFAMFDELKAATRYIYQYLISIMSILWRSMD